MEQKYIKCNNCDADDYTIVFPEGKAQIHRIVKCNNCGLMYANPQTDSNFEIEEDTSPRDNLDLEEVTKELDEQYLRKQYIHQKDYDEIFTFLKDRDRGNLLEVGSHAGVFLNSARERGWNVTGVEPWGPPREYSKLKFGLNVLSESFETAGLEKNSFDVIVSTHVIEHVYNPKIFVQKAYELLKPKGLLIIETPTYDSFSFRLLKHRERSMRCNGHVFLYTKQSLKMLTESCGFKVLKHTTVGRTLSLDRLFYNFGVITNKKKFFENISKKLRLEKFVIHINASDMQRIYCEKI
jgi:2-polyprenyl-3-methyl-5-hydroxy-6-metoxy-1,4-benzoquinol methylase